MSILASSLALGAADYSWRDHALCRDTDPELFFPVGTTGTALVQIEQAKQVCGECDGAGRVPRLRPRHEPGLRHLGRAVRGGAPGHPPPARRPGAHPRRRLTRVQPEPRGARRARVRRARRAPSVTRSSSGLHGPHGDVDRARRPSRSAARSPTNTTSVSCSDPARLRSASAAARVAVEPVDVGHAQAHRRRRRLPGSGCGPASSWPFGTCSVLVASRRRVVTRPMWSTTTRTARRRRRRRRAARRRRRSGPRRAPTAR